MKKTLSILLALALTLPLFACGGAALSEETGTAETLIRRTGEKETEGTSGVHDATGFCAGFAHPAQLLLRAARFCPSRPRRCMLPI